MTNFYDKAKETIREKKFNRLWKDELNELFSNIAHRYDTSNYLASFGLWGWFRHNFMQIIEVNPHERVLDVCAGTNAIGIALLKREKTLQVHALDQNVEMQKVGKANAEKYDFKIQGIIADAHTLPFPDNYFDVVTLQFASRHLRVVEVFKEIYRVLKPGGRFYHCDMLRLNNKILAIPYYIYLRFSLWLTALIFYNNRVKYNYKKYFIDALKNFYSIKELSNLLLELGYTNIIEKGILLGVIGIHRAIKPSLD